MKDFRFGVNLWGTAGRDEWRALAQKAEDLGFDVISAPDHLDDFHPPLLALLAAAEATRRVHVGTMVLNNDFRHPVLVAREAAGMQALTGGRFELGMGAGHSRPEYEAAGLPFDGGATRVARLGESVRIISALLAGGAVSFSGRFYRVTDHAIPAPGQPVPLLIGGNSPRLLALAGSAANIIGFTGLGRTLANGRNLEPAYFAPDAVDERVGLARQAAGDRWPEIELNCLVQAVLLTEDRAAAATRAAAAFGLEPEVILATPFALVGTPRAVAEQLVERRERWGFSYVTVFAKDMDALGKVIAQLR